MTDDGRPGRPLTTRELRAVVYRVSWAYLEVERGLRPYQQLEAFLTPWEYRRHLITNSHLGVESHGPVRPHDIGRVHVARSAPERVDADVLVRRGDDKWSSLVVDLYQTGRGWQVARLDRLENVVLREPPDLVPAPDTAGRLARTTSELEIAAVVRDDIAERIEAIGNRRLRATRDLQDDWERWNERCLDLAHEVATLRRELASTDVEPGAPLAQHENGVSDDRWIGTRPSGGDQALVRDRARESMAAYRDRWGLDPEDDLLGSCESEDQRSDLRHVIARICEYEAACPSREDEPALELALDDMGLA